MNKLRIVYIFVLGSLLGISVSFLGVYLIFGNYIGNYDNQYVNFQSDGIISNIKSTLKSINIGSEAEISPDYKKFDRVMKILEREYYDQSKIDKEKMLDKALKGFVQALEDPHTVYFTNKESNSFEENLEGEKDFEGIGAVVTKKEKGVMIERVIKGAPSYKAGLKPLDIIIKVNGKSTENMSLSEAVSKMRGEKGTKVQLTILRSSREDNKIFDVNVERDSISVPSVMSRNFELTGDKDVGYINISMIGEKTESALKDVISDFDVQNMDGVVLDLRGNGGGFLPVATEVVSHFVPKGKEVVTTKYRALRNKSYDSKGYGHFEDKPVVILVDGVTASAAEIISSAIDFHKDNVKLVGTQTFGKGSIQTLKDLEGGASLKYTIGKWFTPGGKNVDGEGITPDVELDVSEEEYKQSKEDIYIKRAKKEILKLIE